MSRLALSLALVAVLAGCTSPAAEPGRSPAPVPSGAPAFAPCAAGFGCATLAVPLPDGRTVELALTRRPASGERLGVLVVNPGGPGVSAVDSLQASYVGLPAVLRERFDLVAFDPRGVGRSGPVRCATTEQLDRFFALDPSPDTPAEQQAYEQGSAAVAAGCAHRSGDLLPHVSTAAAADDLDRVRIALGEQQVNYLGYSYGTSLGVAYLEAFPDRVRTMVLDGALDPALTWDALLAGQAVGFDTALAAMLADCERTRCALRTAVTGDLGAAFDGLAAEVERTPLPTGTARPVGPGELTLAVGAGLYDRRAGWPLLASALAAGTRGDGRPLLVLSDAYLERTERGYSPVVEANLAVTCLDRPWPRDPQSYADLAVALARDAPRFGPAIAQSGLPCADWPVPAVGEPHPVRAPGAPPVVVLGTTRDPATPYAWSVALADQLPAGVLITYDGDGHTVYRAGAPDCVTDPVGRYLVQAEVPTATRC